MLCHGAKNNDEVLPFVEPEKIKHSFVIFPPIMSEPNIQRSDLQLIVRLRNPPDSANHPIAATKDGVFARDRYSLLRGRLAIV